MLVFLTIWVAGGIDGSVSAMTATACGTGTTKVLFMRVALKHLTGQTQTGVTFRVLKDAMLLQNQPLLGRGATSESAGHAIACEHGPTRVQCMLVVPRHLTGLIHIGVTCQVMQIAYKLKNLKLQGKSGYSENMIHVIACAHGTTKVRCTMAVL